MTAPSYLGTRTAAADPLVQCKCTCDRSILHCGDVCETRTLSECASLTLRNDSALCDYVTAAVSFTPLTDGNLHVGIISACAGGVASIVAGVAIFLHFKRWIDPHIQQHYIGFFGSVLLLFGTGLPPLFIPQLHPPLFCVRAWIIAYLLYGSMSLVYKLIAPERTSRCRDLRMMQYLETVFENSGVDNPKPRAQSLVSSGLPAVRMCAVIIGVSGLTGLLTDKYEYWGYCIHNPLRSWFPLVCVIAAFTVIGAVAVASLLTRLRMVFTPRAWWHPIPPLSLALCLALQEVGIGIVVMFDKLPLIAMFKQTTPNATAIILMNWIVCMECLLWVVVMMWAYPRKELDCPTDYNRESPWINTQFLKVQGTGNGVIEVSNDRSGDVDDGDNDVDPPVEIQSPSIAVRQRKTATHISTPPTTYTDL